METVFVQLAEGFEEIEAVTIIDILRRAGIETQIIAVGDNLLIKGGHGIEVRADLLFQDADFSRGSMIILPGGFVGCNNLVSHAGLANLIKEYFSSRKYVAAICAAPSIVLGGLGVLEGRQATCYPGMENLLVGATFCNSSIVQDGNLITSRGPATAIPFALKLVEVLKGFELANELSGHLLYKDK